MDKRSSLGAEGGNGSFEGGEACFEGLGGLLLEFGEFCDVGDEGVEGWDEVGLGVLLRFSELLDGFFKACDTGCNGSERGCDGAWCGDCGGVCWFVECGSWFGVWWCQILPNSVGVWA